MRKPVGRLLQEPDERVHSASDGYYYCWEILCLKDSLFHSWTILFFLCIELQSAFLELALTLPNSIARSSLLSPKQSCNNSSYFKALVLSLFSQAKHLWLTELFSEEGAL